MSYLISALENFESMSYLIKGCLHNTVFHQCYVNMVFKVPFIFQLLRMCCTGSNRLAELMFSCAIGTITLSVYLYDLHVVFAMN
jgi:hypothetical protein